LWILSDRLNKKTMLVTTLSTKYIKLSKSFNMMLQECITFHIMLTWGFNSEMQQTCLTSSVLALG
jgi:hypothetical protein